MDLELPKPKRLEERVFDIHNEKEFTEIALELFGYQYFTNPVYKTFCESLHKSPSNVQTLEQIPFLPIRFFKTREIKSGGFPSQVVFKSSGTTGLHTSNHYITDVSLYEKSFFKCFERFYGDPKRFCILGLLPSYLEKGDSSLVYMVDSLIKKSGHNLGGFYLYEYEQLKNTLLKLEEQGQPAILFGVSYALLDFAETVRYPLKHTIIIETGGMKGRKKEVSKAELYTELKNAFSVSEIHSEYGMTELLSQAYAINGFYRSPPWMKVLFREATDPFSFSARSGAINVIDLANIYSCSFIATDDLGRGHEDGSFEVLGRIDNSDIRGCSQLM